MRTKKQNQKTQKKVTFDEKSIRSNDEKSIRSNDEEDVYLFKPTPGSAVYDLVDVCFEVDVDYYHPIVREETLGMTGGDVDKAKLKEMGR
jgi:hypothetical protein